MEYQHGVQGCRLAQSRNTRIKAGHFGLSTLTAITLLLANNPAYARKVVPVDSDPAPGSGLTITVRDEINPLANAHVWVETIDGKLLAEGETGASDGRFVASLPEAALAAGVSVTAIAPNHAAVSYLENVAHRVALELPMNPVDSYSVLNGTLTGFKDNDDETRGTLGLVAKAFEMSDLVQLDSSSFVSPLKDTIDVFGPRELPSNIVLPDQTFPIYFIPVHVNKPTYRLPLLSGTSSRVFGVTGTVDVQEAVNVVRNGAAWNIVNLLEFNKIGFSKPISAPAVPGDIALDVVADTAISNKITLKSGSITSSGELHRLAVALWQPEPGIFMPTDVKQVENDDVSLSTVDSQNSRILDVMLTDGGNHFRGAWLQNTATALPDSAMTADLTVDSLDGTWSIRGGETAQLVVAHVESHKKTSVGSGRYEDRWVLVGPRKTQLRLPSVAFHALRDQLGTISHVSVDLLQLGSASYPFINGESTGNDLSVLEKVRKEIH